MAKFKNKKNQSHLRLYDEHGRLPGMRCGVSERSKAISNEGKSVGEFLPDRGKFIRTPNLRGPRSDMIDRNNIAANADFFPVISNRSPSLSKYYGSL